MRLALRRPGLNWVIAKGLVRPSPPFKALFMPFTSLGLSPDLLRAVRAKAYLAPTAIQTAVIPAVLEGRDVLATAQTGSGKTAAFALPLLQQLQQMSGEKPRRVHMLVLVPTRELAAQVADTLKGFALALPQAVKVVSVIGGVSVNPQMMKLRGGADIVVATPGRLLDLVGSNALVLSDVATLVLDEADRLFDLGFADELGRILALLPPKRQNLFFSATFPPAVQTLARQLLSDPVHIEAPAEPQGQPDITQRAIAVDAGRRTQLLRHLIGQNGWRRVLVFVATIHAAVLVADPLRKARINAEPFHGELSQGKRTQVLADFKASRLKVVIATDVASRGLDIAQLPVVLNYDLPRSVQDYIHRIGRTGRAGESGLALSFVSADTEAHWRQIEKHQQLKLPREQIAGFELLAAPPLDSASTGGIKGKRPSKKDKLRAAAEGA